MEVVLKKFLQGLLMTSHRCRWGKVGDRARVEAWGRVEQC
jgi:hypothetical protein